MKHARHLLILVFLFVVWPVQGQTPTTAADYVNRGNSKYGNRDFDGAIADYNKAIEIDPRHALAYNNRGLARGVKGDLDGAIADYNKTIEIDPHYSQAYFNRGKARDDKGDHDGAIADYTKVIEIDPRYAKAYYNRGNARDDKGDHDGALADYNKAIEIDPRLARAYYNRGAARQARSDLDGAIHDYNKYIEIEPRDPDGYNTLAWLLATAYKDSIRDGKKAVEFARKAAELTKWEDANTLDTLAAAYAEAGNFDEAIKWENKALSFAEFAKTSGDEARKHLQLYSEHKPYHEPPPK